MAEHIFTQGGITVSITLPDAAEAVLADQVAANTDWLQGFANMVFNKIGAVSGRVFLAALDEAVSAGTINQLPATRDEVVAARFARPGYKNRAQRDAESPT